jgi:formate hydrogenlyase transcriptional activator
MSDPEIFRCWSISFSAGSAKTARGSRRFQTAMENLTNYSWPGNVRELQNVIGRAVVLAKGSVVEIDNSLLRAEQASLDTLDNAVRNHILRALNETRWVIHDKRRRRGNSRNNPSTLRSRMDKVGIKK